MRSIIILASVLLISQYCAAQNVGIGTNTPNDKLHVAGGILSDSLRVIGANGSNMLAQFNFYAAGLDQAQTLAGAINGNDVPGWQSFKAAFNGNLDSVAFSWNNVFTTALTITIYNGEGTTGTVLFSKAINTRSATIDNPFTTVAVQGISVVAGQVYTIGLSTSRLWGWATSNPYAGGKSNINDGVDYSFKTYVGGNSPGLVIKNAGMIGIGTNNPSSRLDVAGDLTVRGNITLSGTLNYNGSFTNESPVNLPMLNGWINYGPGFTGATYYKDRTGIVHLEGLVKNGTSNIIGNLPAGYRPGGTQIFIAVNGYAAFARIDIGSDGNIIAVDPFTNGYLSLSGISFRAVQ
jgi:hypothetical protein